MFSKLHKLYKYFQLKIVNDSMNSNTEKPHKIPKSIDAIKKLLKNEFEDCSDFVLREAVIGEKGQLPFIVAFIDGLANKEYIQSNILTPLMVESRDTKLGENFDSKNSLEILRKFLLPSGELTLTEDFQKTISGILSGDTAIYVDGSHSAFIAGTKGWDSRNVSQPETENVIRGPREGFVESIRTNTALIRRKIKNPKLKFELMVLGEQTKTDVCICYIKGLVNEEILDTVRRRLNRIKTDAILESGYLEQFIEDSPFSLFPTVANSEKPDKVAAKLLEGRVAILCDGTPFVLTVPYLFIETIHTSEDYYARTYFGSFTRWLRALALVISGTLPGFYVAILSFHADVIPFKLILSIASTREGVPITPLMEALFMGVVFELLREAGIRMPRAVGQAVNIVGALVIGDAAVQAGLVSPIMVIVVALTGITSFIVPSISDTLPIFRTLVIIAASILGFMGMLLMIMVFFIHMCSLRSFGVPYMSPFAPLSLTDLKDTLIRAPLWMMRTRPRVLTWDNEKAKYRQEKTVIKKED